MKITYSGIHKKTLQAYLSGVRHIVNEGGTSSSKTFSTLQLLTDIAFSQPKTSPESLLISVVSESMPHLKAGALRDFRKIMGPRYEDRRMNLTDHIYNFDNAQMEFFSADNPGKATGPRRDILFLNEVINIPKDIVDAFIIRTLKTVFYDFNPCYEFWLHHKKTDPEVYWIHSTYQDAKQFLPPAIVKDIESRRETDPNWWHVFGEGKTGILVGLVHSKFDTVETLPEGGSVSYGLDFGFANSPTALVKNVIIEDRLYSQELIYEKGLTNDDLARRMEELGVRKGYDEIFADSAEPKSIEEIYRFGFDIKPAFSKAVTQGIQKVNQYKQFWTADSVNGIKEQRNYRYVTDKHGDFTNCPSKVWDHLMDARRYAIMSTWDTSPFEIYTGDDLLTGSAA